MTLPSFYSCEEDRSKRGTINKSKVNWWERSLSTDKKNEQVLLCELSGQ